MLVVAIEEKRKNIAHNVRLGTNHLITMVEIGCLLKIVGEENYPSVS